MLGWRRLHGDLVIWDSDVDEDTEEEARMKTGEMDLTLTAADADPAVATAALRREAVARELAETEAQGLALVERMHPRVREEPVPKSSTIVAWLGAGVGFGKKEIEHVDRRVVRPEVDPVDVELARIEYPEVRRATLQLRRKLDEAERDLRAARAVAWARSVPAADAEVRAALGEIAADLARVARKMQTFVDKTIPALNARVGRDPAAPEHAPLRYHLPELVFPPIVVADPRSGSRLDGWRESLRKAGWLEG
jgi:hypothetical protein